MGIEYLIAIFVILFGAVLGLMFIVANYIIKSSVHEDDIDRDREL